ncbi:MAG: hypothetical protein Q9222_005878 [Ikaeria aurantiellina]
MASCFLCSILLILFSIIRVLAASADCAIAPLSLPWSNITVSTNGVAVTRGIELGVGTPNQIFSLRPSTTLNNTRIANVLDCGSETNTSCVGSKGGVYDSTKSSTYKVSLKDRWNGSAADTETANGAYVYFNDIIDFQVNGTVRGYPLVEDSDFTSRAQAGLPLGQNSSFLAAITQAEVAPSSVWGLYAGDRSLSPIDGNLVLGGYDTSRINGSLAKFPIGDWALQRPCPLQVTVAEILYVTPDGSQSPLLSNQSDGMTACVEPFQERFTFTPDVVHQFANLTSYNSSYPKLTYPVRAKPNGSLQITLDNGYTTTIPNDHLVTLKRGSDTNGHYVVTNSSIVETGIAYNVDQDPSTVTLFLGGTYLTFNYLVVDYDNNQFQMAPVVQGPRVSKQNLMKMCTPTATNTTAPVQEKDTGGSSNAAAIGGGVGGGVGGLIVIAAIGLFVYRKQRRRRQEQQQQQERRQSHELFSPTTTATEISSEMQSPAELPLVSNPHPMFEHARLLTSSIDDCSFCSRDA